MTNTVQICSVLSRGHVHVVETRAERACPLVMCVKWHMASYPSMTAPSHSRPSLTRLLPIHPRTHAETWADTCRDARRSCEARSGRAGHVGAGGRSTCGRVHVALGASSSRFRRGHQRSAQRDRRNRADVDALTSAALATFESLQPPEEDGAVRRELTERPPPLHQPANPHAVDECARRVAADCRCAAS